MFKHGTTGPYTKGTGQIIKLMEKDGLSTPPEKFMTGTGTIQKHMELDFMPGKTRSNALLTGTPIGNRALPSTRIL